jgi:cell division protein FtsL
VVDAAIGRVERARARERAGGRTWPTARVVVLIVLAVVAAVALVWTEQQRTATAYALSDAHARRTAAERENARLLRDLAAMKSPERLALQAPRFGLAEPTQVLQVP